MAWQKGRAISAPGDRVLTGVVLMLTFGAVAPLIDVASKLVAQGVPVGVVTLGRFIVQLALMAPIILWLRLPMAMSPQGIFWLWVFGVGLAATIGHMAIT